ncbi:hypothetical protein RDABS01_007660 [Bienertia sinuspersici]
MSRYRGLVSKKYAV